MTGALLLMWIIMIIRFGRDLWLDFRDMIQRYVEREIDKAF